MDSHARTSGTTPGAATPFGEQLRRYRERSALTQQELAERAGLSVEGVSALERGVRRYARPFTVRALAAALQLSADERSAFAAAVPRVGDGAGAESGSAFKGASPAPRRGELPVPATLIVGREREEAAIVRLLERPDVRLLTLTGPGGIGKTRLATQTAAGAGDRHGEACFVDLASIRDATLVPSAIVDALGLQEQGGRPPLERLLAVLAGERRLLLLDNFEHVVSAAPIVAAFLANCPQVKLLVTSRAPLRLRGEHEFPVAPLAVPAPARAPLTTDLLGYAAIRLFVERAQAVDPTFALSSVNAAAVAEICRRLDGLPLAIELAAARARVLPPAALLSRLSDRFALLTEGPVDAPPRQRTLRAAIDWSYDLLGEDEQALFCHLSAFVGGFTLEAAEAVGGEGGKGGRGIDTDTLALVEALVAKNLLRRRDAADAETPRFELLETVREYGLERLATRGGEEATREAHAAYFMAFAEQAEAELVGPAQRQWLDRLEAEHANLRAALDWLTDREEHTALRLAAACCWFWWYRGHYAEGRARLETLLARSDAAADGRAWAAATSGLGLLIQAQGEYARAAQLHEEAVAAWRRLADPHRLSEALFLFGLTLLYSGDERAYGVMKESMELSRSLPNPWWLGGALWGLGRALHRQGNFAQAAVAIDESLARARELENPTGIAVSLWGIGELAWDQGDEARGLDLLHQAMALFWDSGEAWCAILCLERLAAIGTRGNPQQAARLFGAAAAWREEIGLPQPPAEVEHYERSVAALQAALGDAVYAKAWAAGQHLTPEQAIVTALESVDGLVSPNGSVAAGVRTPASPAPDHS